MPTPRRVARTTSPARRNRRVGAAIVVSTVAASLFPLASATASTASAVRVIVMARPGASAQAEASIVRLHGTVQRRLGVIEGFAATMSPEALASLQDQPSVRSVQRDQAMTALSRNEDAAAQSAKSKSSGDQVDEGSLSFVTKFTGAQELWQQGITGKGVDVALIDTGVSQVAGLNGDQVIDGPDLSFDSQYADQAYIDGYGHGTHMAGIIAGNDVGHPSVSKKHCDTCLNDSAFSDTTKFVGVAPESRLVNVKVGAADGATDVSQVIAAIDWVVQHRTDNGMNIKVLNLSFGTLSTQSYDVDPLAYAAEVAWKKGIVVVAAAGNDGRGAPSLADPAYDPTILAVGALDTHGTARRSDDTVADFANSGTADRPVDVMAPSMHIASLRSPGSFVDQNTTTGRVGDRLQRGTGTSQAAAVTSGLAALLIQRYPNATPDQIKTLLTSNAQPLVRNDRNSYAAGNGAVDVSHSISRSLLRLKSIVSASPAATGLGSLDAARGDSYVYDNGVALRGEQDIFGNAWDAASWSASSWAGTSWQAGTWNAARWSGDTWEAARWSAARWSSARWSAARWSGLSWAGSDWSAARWSAARWSAARWSGDDWAAARWSAARWSSASWD